MLHHSDIDVGARTSGTSHSMLATHYTVTASVMEKRVPPIAIKEQIFGIVSSFVLHLQTSFMCLFLGCALCDFELKSQRC